MKVELDALDLVNLIRACHFAERDYLKWSDTCSSDGVAERASCIERANEFNGLASRLVVFLQSQKVED